MPILASASSGSMTTAVSDLMGVVSTVISTITANQILLVFFCAGVVGLAIGIVRKLKH